MEREETKAAMLIVDDGERNRAVLRQIFQDTFSIFEAVNGKAALRLLEKCGVDVILLDTMMPVMDGFEFLRDIRWDERFADIPVVMMTAREESGSEVRAIEMGALDCLIRPFHPAVAISGERVAKERADGAASPDGGNAPEDRARPLDRALRAGEFLPPGGFASSAGQRTSLCDRLL